MYIPIDALILFQTTPAGIVAEPQKVAIFIGYLSWYADLVAVEVMGLLAAFSVFVDPVAYLCQRLVRTGVLCGSLLAILSRVAQ